MIVTLSDYIMEQEVSSASCDDIIIEQAKAEMDVNYAIANAYYKQITMLEYAAEYGTSLYSEADTETETEEKTGFGAKVGKFFSTIWKAIVAAFTWIGKQFEKLWGWIKGLFTKNTADQLRNIATSDKVDEAVAKIKEDLKSKDLKLEDFEEIIATKGVKQFIEKGIGTYNSLTTLADQLNGAIKEVNVESVDSALKEIKKLTGELATGKETLIGKKSTGSLTDDASPVKTEKNRDLLNQMADFVEWTAGEGRGKIDSLQKQMQEFDYKLDQITRSLPDVKADDTTNKQKQLVNVFKIHGDVITSNCTKIAKEIGGINCIYSACRAATQVAYKNADKRKTAARDDDMYNRIDGYLKKHPDASPSEIAKAVGATAEDIKKHTTMVGGQEWPEKKENK